MERDITVAGINRKYCGGDCPYLIGAHAPYACHNSNKALLVSDGINQVFRSKECLALDGLMEGNNDVLEMLTTGEPDDVVNVLTPRENTIPEAVYLKVEEKERGNNLLDVQVGGDHYKKLKIQPVEYIYANKLDFFQGAAIKYITRFRDKNGKKDLEKAKHFIEMLIMFEYGDGGKV